MAISQVAKGIYVVSPNQVKKYRDSAAGEYTSVFTKERANQWEMAQKQALLELELGSKQYAEEMKTYRDRLDALDARRKELEGLKVRVAEGRLDAKDAAAIAALREETSRQKTAADFAAKKAEVITMSPGSTTTTTSTAGGRGGKGPTLGDVSTDDEAEIEAALAESAGDPAIAAVAVKARRDSKTLGSATPEETDAQNFKVINDLADMRVGSTGEDIETATDNILLELSQTDPQFAASHARVTAKQAQIEGGGGGTPTTRTTTRPADVTTRKRPGLGELPPTTPVTPAITESDEALQKRIDAQIAAVGTDRAGLTRPSMAGFDYITRARDIAAGRFGPVRASPSYGQRNAIEALLRADPQMRTAIIESFSKGGVPVPGGVSGPVAPGAAAPSAATAPAAPAPAPTTEGGWESVGVVKPSTGDAKADEAAYQAAKVAWSESQAAARATPALPAVPEYLGPPIAPGQSAESLMAEAVDVGAYARTPGLTPGGQSALQRLADTKFAEAEGRMAVESRIGAETAAAERPFQIPFEERGGELVPFFRKPGGRADQRALDEYIAKERDAAGRAAPPMGTYPSAPEIRPEAADLMTEAEKQQFRDKLAAATARPRFTGAFADPEAEALFQELGVPVTARTAALQAPSAPPRIGIEDMLSQRSVSGLGASQVADTLGTVRAPSGVTPPSAPPSIGRYAPGPIPAPIPMAGPSTALAAPRSPAELPEGTFDRPSRPLVANMKAGMAIKEGTESMEASGAAKKKMDDIKAAGAIDAFRGPKTGPGQTKEGYLLNRLEGAYLLAKRADKLSRVSASGPGKVAYDLYVANKAKGIPFGRTYEEITLTFAGDGPSMEKAHEAALALDIKDRDTAPGGK
jgi:hypothetical protein